MSSSPLIELRDIKRTFLIGDVEQEILHGINLTIEAGQLAAVMGPSGSGKSTAMNIVGLLDKPSSGQYLLKGEPVENLDDDTLADLRNRTIGFVFQAFFLLPRLTALQNVGLPLRYRGLDSTEIKERSISMLKKVGMEARANHFPSQLSGGQQQRVAVARALAGDTDMILADEPTGALDSKTSREVMDLFVELNEEESKTIIIITHDPKVGERCKRMIRIKDGYVEQS